MPKPDVDRYAEGRECPTDDVLEVAVRSGFTECDSGLETHLERCDYCCAQVERITRSDLQELLDTRVAGPIDTVPETRNPQSRFSAGLGMTAVLLSVANGVISFVRASEPRVSRLDFLKLFQTGLIEWGVILVLLPCAICGGLLLLNKPVRKTVIAVSLCLSVMLTVGCYGWSSIQQQLERRVLDRMFMSCRFASFDSPSADPETNPNPTADQLLRELRILHDEGNFDGLITFGLYDWPKGDIRLSLPALAKEAGFKAMVCGIYVSPDGKRPDEQLNRAIKFETEMPKDENIVIGFCLGHNVPPSVPIDSLATWMQELRSATGKPVSSTFPVVAYLGDRGQQIREIGDFWIPDIHAAWHLEASPQKALEETRADLKSLTVLPADRPVLLTMIMFPTAGSPGASEEAQKQFFEGVTRDLYLPRGVYVSVFGFDSPFKGRLKDQFAASDEFAGLFTAEGKPKPALDKIRKNWPVQNRP